ncbi:MAG: acetate--CoA ligase family protein [Burkholderiales bacterium]|nr:acetate--CoA ligase family protein [Burkholderiales bacterium]
MSMAPDQLIREARAAGRGALDELSGKRLLARFGIAVPRSTLVQPHEPLARKLAGLRPPFVLKVASPDILHKSDVGGVRTRLGSVEDVETAMRVMLARPEIGRARLDGFLVEEMAPAGQELVIGAVRDPQFGPLVMVGLGGILVEVLRDVAFRICPIERVDALEMLEELKGRALLDGVRGQAAVSREAIVDALLKFAGPAGLLMTLAADIAEADINPLIVSAGGAVAADARFILTPETKS